MEDQTIISIATGEFTNHPPICPDCAGTMDVFDNKFYICTQARKHESKLKILYTPEKYACL